MCLDLSHATIFRDLVVFPVWYGGLPRATWWAFARDIVVFIARDLVVFREGQWSFMSDLMVFYKVFREWPSGLPWNDMVVFHACDLVSYRKWHGGLPWVTWWSFACDIEVFRKRPDGLPHMTWWFDLPKSLTFHTNRSSKRPDLSFQAVWSDLSHIEGL